ncbi:OrfE protein [Alloactinosynnema sp. L-07]|uniref:hypothetical protein n=1 Tax=Alloactinosynnema sp. L-07 TaxID=1653480 RepID=UPI00065F09A2|nr:hypothetical protein [Alloactinosynnema sp. L-07]CRK57282.1 OrfE protein [Alloactinosynnema sp. L-07]
MIDWAAMTGVLADVLSREGLWDVVDERVRGGEVFRNKDFPLSPVPVLIDHGAATEYAAAVEKYVQLLNKIIRLYVAEDSVRRWYGLTAEEEALVLADQRLGGEVAVCRLDGYLEQGTERPVLLENNADAPAGTLFTARINHLVRGLLADLGARAHWSPLTYAEDTALLSTLRACARRAGAPEPGHIAILQPTGAANRESVETVEVLRRAGVEAFLADPRDARLVGKRVFFGDKPADACWNKVNTATWRTLLAEDPATVHRLLDIVTDAEFVHVNPFGARYVAESKLSLALPREPEFAHLFTDDDRALVESLLPWGRRLTPRATAENGASLADDLVENQAAYVLKEAYDIRGDGVTIGRAVSRSSWLAAVARGLDEGHLVQRHVAPAAYPTVRRDGPRVVAMPISLDTYLFNGRVAGFGSKASLNARVNVFQGGQKLAVHVGAVADAR